MKRQAPHHLPKHVRELVQALSRAGAKLIEVATSKLGYRISWRCGEIDMQVGAPRSASGNTVESVWRAVRRLFRQHHLPVPA